MTEVTRALAKWVVGSRLEDIPASVRQSGVRSFLNWMGCAVGGSRHETIDIAVRALTPFAGAPRATILGRGERVDAPNAALLNGMSSHVFDFDDTHLKTIIHPAGPVASAVLAMAEQRVAQREAQQRAVARATALLAQAGDQGRIHGRLRWRDASAG